MHKTLDKVKIAIGQLIKLISYNLILRNVNDSENPKIKEPISALNIESLESNFIKDL